MLRIPRRWLSLSLLALLALLAGCQSSPPPAPQAAAPIEELKACEDSSYRTITFWQDSAQTIVVSESMPLKAGVHYIRFQNDTQLKLEIKFDPKNPDGIHTSPIDDPSFTLDPRSIKESKLLKKYEVGPGGSKTVTYRFILTTPTLTLVSFNRTKDPGMTVED